MQTTDIEELTLKSPLDEDNLLELLTVYDNKEVNNDDVKATAASSSKQSTKGAGSHLIVSTLESLMLSHMFQLSKRARRLPLRDPDALYHHHHYHNTINVP
ncbi:hypothetical protein M0802_001978 [Mischocyttarus mexicanus]|nr:hypothetical protein M0802_001978 [Mischocyttarus mexicanus]